MPDSATKRDPRIDPQPGDVLRCCNERRSVIISGWDRFVPYRRIGFGNHVFTVSRPDWRKWAKNAEVIAEAPNGK